MSKETEEVKYWIMPVYGCVEPEGVIGPYKTYGGMVKRARKLLVEQKFEDAMFWLRTGMGTPIVGAFTNLELEETE